MRSQSIYTSFVSSLFLALQVAVGWAEAPVLRVELSPSHLRENTAYFEVFIKGKKVGWMRQSLHRKQLEGEDVITFETEFLQKLLNGGETITMRSLDVEYFAAEAPYPLVAATSLAQQNGFESDTRIRRTVPAGDEFTARISSGKSEREKAIGALDYTLGDSLAGVVWCEGQPEVGAAVRLRELDLTDLEVRTALHTIRRRLPESGEGSLKRGGLIGKYEIDYYDKIGKTRARFVSNAHGQLLGGRVGGSVELRLSTAEAARKLTAGLDLFESSLIKVAVPLGNPSEIRALELEISGPGIGAIVDSPEQDAEPIEGGGRLLLKVGKKHGQRIPVTAAERVESLEETNSYPINDPQVIALVERAVGRATRPKARIKRLVEFVDEFIIDDASNEPLTVNDIIDSQRGDCTEHSQLFVTMARAAGIPAREVSGFIYGEASTPSFGGHAWCEVEIDGHWHSVDPSWGETMINATHIRISGDQPSTEEMDLYLGGLKFRVLSVTGRGGVVRRIADPVKQP